ncbi:MAG TPA: type 4a pilus biogenesis protein PilO, partial [Candidatus Omnitrophota bacterium]|nr:type 4a pilus biogenesis protein PilO [Candidatus Omnitrophota bacterium]
ANLWKKANTYKTDIRVAKEDFKSENTYKEKRDVLKKEMADLDKKTIIQEEMPRALETISKAADMSAVKILKIRPMAEIKSSQKPIKISATKEFYREKISISAIAGFHQLGRFMALLENSSIFYDIKKLEIRSDTQGYMKHSITIILDVMVRKS